MQSEITRRQFQGTAIQSLLTFSLLETLFGAELFAKDIQPVTAQWLKELNTIAQDLKGTKLTQAQWKTQCEKLFKQVNLKDLLEFIDFNGRISETPFREKGERAIRF
nr:hypothetical protein [Pirellulaceae bacterium]